MPPGRIVPGGILLRQETLIVPYWLFLVGEMSDRDSSADQTGQKTE